MRLEEWGLQCDDVPLEQILRDLAGQYVCLPVSRVLQCLAINEDDWKLAWLPLC